MAGAPAWESDRRAAAVWAQGLLAAPAGRVVVLDTETTSLDGYLVELAVTDLQGRVLLGTQLNPGTPIDAKATSMHRLAAAQLGAMPRFGEVAGTLARILRDRTVVIYNAAFDMQILRNEIRRLDPSADEVREALNTARWECAMQQYAAFCGEWNDYHGNYRWQRLPGGDHTALGDCRATIAILAQMAAEAAERSPDEAS
ncbi:3'-5' exonuclease [Actinomadura syzygii]|uniref:3'-5' exonuclease n=1 Tax=Actinomadura syzygii TaxID=1427538 RepID=A0A5D0TYZ0_9ACTN|nr:3'-5' exonuclease [Actinomadura syzygii]TYC11551.1 3'-5' exonuclease [Actinomadura syzygii]